MADENVVCVKLVRSRNRLKTPGMIARMPICKRFSELARREEWSTRPLPMLGAVGPTSLELPSPRRACLPNEPVLGSSPVNKTKPLLNSGNSVSRTVTPNLVPI